MAVHNFDTKIAKKYGIAEAVVLWNLCYWQNHNEANKINFHEERYWTYNSVSAFSEIFEYLSNRQIERILLKLEKEKVLVSGRFNKMKIDRTKWYSVESEIMALHGFKPISPNGEMQPRQNVNATTSKRECNSPNGEMDFTKRGNGFHQTVEPIPNNKQDNKQDNKLPIEGEFEFLFSNKYFKDTYSDFLKMRKEIKAKNTERAQKIILKKIEKLSERKIETAIEILEQSIMNNWKGIFPLKNNSSFPYGKSSAENKSFFESAQEKLEYMNKEASKYNFDEMIEAEKKNDPFAK